MRNRVCNLLCCLSTKAMHKVASINLQNCGKIDPKNSLNYKPGLLLLLISTQICFDVTDLKQRCFRRESSTS